MSEVMKVGELARRTGLSVRTLHHYDELGLLVPTRRTSSGHRLYGLDEVERLQRIVSLKQLGLSLDEISDCLGRAGYSLERVVQMQLERLDREMAMQRRLRSLLEHLLDRLHSPGGATLDELTRTIEVTMSYEKHYTPEQLERLERRRREVGEERIEEVQREWQELFDAYGDAMDRGLDPGGDEVQVLARKSTALIAEFTGGDPGIRESLGAMYRSEGPGQVLEGHGMSMRPGLWEYMGRATSALKEEQ